VMLTGSTRSAPPQELFINKRREKKEKSKNSSQQADPLLR